MVDGEVESLNSGRDLQESPVSARDQTVGRSTLQRFVRAFSLNIAEISDVLDRHHDRPRSGHPNTHNGNICQMVLRVVSVYGKLYASDNI